MVATHDVKQKLRWNCSEFLTCTTHGQFLIFTQLRAKQGIFELSN